MTKTCIHYTCVNTSCRLLRTKWLRHISIWLSLNNNKYNKKNTSGNGKTTQISSIELEASQSIKRDQEEFVPQKKYENQFPNRTTIGTTRQQIIKCIHWADNRILLVLLLLFFSREKLRHNTTGANWIAYFLIKANKNSKNNNIFWMQDHKLRSEMEANVISFRSDLLGVIIDNF